MKEQPFSTAEQMQQILNAESAPKHETFYRMAAEADLHAGELCGLQWPDVKDGFVDVVRTFVEARSSRRRLQLHGALLSRLSVRRVWRACESNRNTCSARKKAHRGLLMASRSPILLSLLNSRGLAQAGFHAFQTATRQSWREGCQSRCQFPCG